ncbi:MAG: terminase family protein [Acidobacteria bacterium]|nr:terminase family protein [Acidobacteriota bacterium]
MKSTSAAPPCSFRQWLLHQLLNLKALATMEKERNRRLTRRKMHNYYADAGPLRRELYPRHLEFFAAGATHRERLMLAANRVGKTEGVGGYELALHLTGRYPEWWVGRRFPRAIRAWAAGDTSKTVREILQYKLLGPPGSWGTGLIPGDDIIRTIRAQGIADTLDSVVIRHASGSQSQLVFKSYDQRRESFQGTEQDVIWLDEEPPLDIYTECLLRTMTNQGMVMCTFTPLLGMSDVVLHFLPGGKMEPNLKFRNFEISKSFVVMATWDDAPHLSEDAKRELWASIPPYQRDARSKGIPQLGSGAIYPVPEADIAVAPFQIPPHWPQGFGFDTDSGAGYTAAVWGALDRERQVLYLTDCYKRERAEVAIHVQAMKSRGEWIPGVGDAAALRVTAHDAEQVITLYRRAGLDVMLPDKSVEAGIHDVWEMLSQGRLRVFSHLKAWFEEYRLYRRDDKGFVVKQNDHLMDATRYLVHSGMRRMKTRPAPQAENYRPASSYSPWS